MHSQLAYSNRREPFTDVRCKSPVEGDLESGVMSHWAATVRVSYGQLLLYAPPENEMSA
jgi:hypothetical protein